jgi:hypothetical protein
MIEGAKRGKVRGLKEREKRRYRALQVVDYS